MKPRDRANDAFGSALRHHRLLAGLTQGDLAEAAHVSIRTVRNLERGGVAAQRRTAELLADALGLHGPARQRLLAAAGRPHHGEATAPAAGVFGLPPDLPDFVGREAELDWLLALGEPVPGEDPAGTVAVISGPPGVGKTALLVRAAHRLAGRFAGRVVFLGLGGAGGEPLTADEALADLLAALGVAAERLPASGGERVTLYRMLTADGPGLLVLDNVTSEEQARSLLPAGRRWLTLLSSRGSLAGLTAVRRLPVDPLSDAESRLLLAGLLGAGRVARAPMAAAELAALCGRLPLALRLVAGRLLDRPQWSIEALAESLRDERRRADLLGAGDHATRRALVVSYRRLGDQERLVLRRAALLPGAAVSAVSAAVATGIDPADTADLLDSLADTGLLSPAPQADRYLLHDLVRAFAQERAEAEEAPADRDRTLDRIADWLLAGVSEAARWFDPHPDPVERLGPAATPAPAVELRSAAEAESWLTGARVEWWWAIRRVALAGRHETVLTAARALYWYADSHYHAVPWVELFDLSVAAAQALDDQREEALQRRDRGWAYGTVLRRPLDGLADLDRAMAYFERAAADSALGLTAWIASQLNLMAGRLDEATVACRRALAVFEAATGAQDRIMAGTCRTGLAQIEAAQGEHDAAIARLGAVIAGAGPGGTAIREQLTLTRANLTLAGLYQHRRQWVAAVAAGRRALDHVTVSNHPIAYVRVLTVLGTALAHTEPAEARVVLRQAVRTARDNFDLIDEATAGLALADLLTGAERAELRHRAAEICGALATPEAERLRARIAADPFPGAG
ncbi:helix-turn-helix domain-containing protein [Dactylosporangium sp. NPDC050688]|uniref:helix-turn-helix domain-containing protein n=1 Tax=Dactylosporangium sp. NPDC050688 TaxID=3157217 RepID=UPI0033C628C1